MLSAKNAKKMLGLCTEFRYNISAESLVLHFLYFRFQLHHFCSLFALLSWVSTISVRRRVNIVRKIIDNIASVWQPIRQLLQDATVRHKTRRVDRQNGRRPSEQRSDSIEVTPSNPRDLIADVFQSSRLQVGRLHSLQQYAAKSNTSTPHLNYNMRALYEV